MTEKNPKPKKPKKKKKLVEITEFEFDEMLLGNIKVNNDEIRSLQRNSEVLYNTYLKKERAKQKNMVLKYYSDGTNLQYEFKKRRTGFGTK